MKEVTSPQGDFVKDYLPARRKRDGIAYVEGERTSMEALSSDWPADALLLDVNFSQTPAATVFQRRAEARGIPIVAINRKALARISDCESPPPVGVLLRPAIAPLREMEAAPQSLLVLDRLADPGNVGTLIRSAAAFGFHVVLTDGSVKPSNEKMLRASAGMAFRHDGLLSGGAAPDLAQWLGVQGYRVVVLDPHEGEILGTAAAPAGPLALVLGEEADGVDWTAWGAALRMRIPMARGVESLNVAVSGAIALYELNRGRALA